MGPPVYPDLHVGPLTPAQQRELVKFRLWVVPVIVARTPPNDNHRWFLTLARDRLEARERANRCGHLVVGEPELEVEHAERVKESGCPPHPGRPRPAVVPKKRAESCP